jgi:hypothetical protein
VIRAVVSVYVDAPVERVRALYATPEGWSRLFPATIRGARVVRRSGGVTEVLVDHVEGGVRNLLREVSPARFELVEWKRRYDATFTSEFLPEGRGTRYVLGAAVRLRWPYRLLAPFVKPLVVARMRRYAVEPLRAAAEAAGGR